MSAGRWDIAALLSPTHLGLFVGALLIVTTPLRSAWADPGLAGRVGLGRLLPAVLSMTLAGCLAAFMFQYLHPVDENVVSIGHAQAMAQDFTSFQYPVVQRLAIQAGVSGFVLSTALLFGPLLVLLRRWRPPAGTAAGSLRRRPRGAQERGRSRQNSLPSGSRRTCQRPPS